MELLLGLALIVPAAIVFLIIFEMFGVKGRWEITKREPVNSKGSTEVHHTSTSSSIFRKDRALAKRIGMGVVVLAFALVTASGPSIYRKVNCNGWYENLDELDLKASMHAISGEGGKRAFLELCNETGQPVHSALLLDIQVDASRASNASNAASADQLEDVERRLYDAIRRQY